MNFQEQWSDTCSLVGYAAKVGDFDLLQDLINQKKPVDVGDNRGWKPIHEAAALGPSLACLEEILKHEKTNVNWVTHEGETPLLLACKRRHGSDASAVVSLLLKYGADPNIVDNEEESPLLASMRNNSKDVVELLLAAGADVNHVDCSRWSPLHEAATRNNTTLLHSLLRRDAVIDVQDECGMTPIFTAAQHGSELCLNLLLASAKEKGLTNVVNIGAEDWATPLMIAAQQGFSNCIKILLEYGAFPDLLTNDHATALHMAIQGNHESCVNILLEKMNLQPMISSFHPSSYDNSEGMICPLHLAVEWQSHTCLKALLAAGFSPNSIYDSVGFISTGCIPLLWCRETALSFAAFKRNAVAMTILLSAGANCNPPTEECLHPLIRAMANPTLQEFNMLIAGGADVNHKRQRYVTNEVFLHCLLFNGMFLYPLLYYGCDPNMCFLSDHMIFVRCALRFLRRETMVLTDFLKLLSRFVISTKNVQNAFHTLCSSVTYHQAHEILQEIDQPSSLKKICIIRLRQHLYGMHGVRFASFVPRLHLPRVLQNLVACEDLKPSVTLTFD